MTTLSHRKIARGKSRRGETLCLHTCVRENRVSKKEVRKKKKKEIKVTLTVDASLLLRGNLSRHKAVSSLLGFRNYRRQDRNSSDIGFFLGYPELPRSMQPPVSRIINTAVCLHEQSQRRAWTRLLSPVLVSVSAFSLRLLTAREMLDMPAFSEC